MSRVNTKFVKALGNRYKHCSGYEAAKLITNLLKDRAAPLSPRQEEVLRDEFGDSGILGDLDVPFQVLKWEERKPEGVSVLWRLTLPLLWIWAFIFRCIIQPIKWVFTGKMYFSHKSFLNYYTTEWYNKIFRYG